MQAITDKYYELTNAICDAEVTIVGEDGVERRAAYGDLPTIRPADHARICFGTRTWSRRT